jgi:protein-L-isoaspartate(D-aspartate) O-methyltransferase
VEDSSERARFNMIQQQVRPWDVLDERVLGVMESIPREPFVPDAYQGLAYADIEVPLVESDAGVPGDGGRDGKQSGRRAMLAPKVLGRLLQALDVQPGDKVLEIGCGSGYLTACLSRLGGRVVATDTDADLAARARERLADRERVEILEHDALSEKTPGGPFAVIAVNGSLPSDAPLALLCDQLATGGRLFCIVGPGPVMEARLITRVGPRDLRDLALFETSAPPLPQAPEPEQFIF